MQRIAWAAAALLSIGCQEASKAPVRATTSEPSESASEPAAATSAGKPEASETSACPPTSGEPLPGSIGSASMAPDGTITLFLRATGAGAVGDGMAVYPRSHPEYKEVLDHLGGLKPGETKPVPPWD